MSDVIADMLTRIRNANNAKHQTVDIPASNLKKAIAEILTEEGYVKSYQVLEDGKQGTIRITLKYLHIIFLLMQVTYSCCHSFIAAAYRRLNPTASLLWRPV